jgi:hypothetical protein
MTIKFATLFIGILFVTTAWGYTGADISVWAGDLSLEQF